MTRDEIWLLNEKYHGEKTEGFFADCNRLRLGEPLAYIIGSIPFLNTTILLDSHPLIPRPETEYLVEKVLHDIHTRLQDSTDTTIRILDLCAGSGCIGVAILKNIPESSVDFVEIDQTHHATIEKNIYHNDILPTRTHIVGGDLFEYVEGRYDYILSNPPYIDPELDRTDESVKKFEPHHALYGGVKGMEIITRLLQQTPLFLTPSGILFFEHEPEQVPYIHEYAETCGLKAFVQRDQYGIERYSSVQIRR